MGRHLILFSFVLAIVGCSSTYPVKTETWRASVDHGDKPGVGIEIIRAENKITGSMFLLDPNKPNNFSVGIKKPILVHKSSNQEIQFEIKWNETLTEEMVLDFDEPLSGKPVHAILKSSDNSSSPQDFEFFPVR